MRSATLQATLEGIPAVPHPCSLQLLNGSDQLCQLLSEDLWSITVFFKEIEDIFNASSSQVSWISSIMLAVMYGGGKWVLTDLGKKISVMLHS
ncbi:monocarboxylate transporter 1-like [Arapaima gigas]